MRPALMELSVRGRRNRQKGEIVLSICRENRVSLARRPLSVRGRLVTPLIFAAGRLFAADLTADDVLRMSMDSQTRQEQMQRQYVWHEQVELGPANKEGTGRTKTTLRREFEVSYEGGSVYRTIVAENGIAIAPKEAEKKKVHVRRKVLALSAIASEMTNKLLDEETIDGRKCWVVQSESANTPYRWTVWIDEDEKVIIRVVSELLRETPEVKAGARTTVSYSRNDLGVWLPTRQISLFTGNGFLPARAFQTIDFSAYRRFTTDANILYGDPN